jgi:hypothetical protein
MHQSLLVENKARMIALENQVKFLKAEISRSNIEHEVEFQKLKCKYGVSSVSRVC